MTKRSTTQHSDVPGCETPPAYIREKGRYDRFHQESALDLVLSRGIDHASECDEKLSSGFGGIKRFIVEYLWMLVWG